MRSLLRSHFTTSFPQTGIPVAHMRVPKINSVDAVFTTRMSNTSQETRPTVDNEFLVDTNKNIFVDFPDFLVTRYFSENGIPLYLKHTLKYPVFGNHESTDITIVDENGRESTGALFYSCNQRTVYHNSTHTDKPLFVSYIPTINGVAGDTFYREVLSTGPAMIPATAAHLDDCGLAPDADAYNLVEEDGKPYFWRVELPTNELYSLKYLANTPLSVTIEESSSQEPWYLTVANVSLRLTNSTNKTQYRYNISEFDIQGFYPHPPFKLKSSDICTWLSSRTFQASETGLSVTPKTPLDLLVKDINGVPVRAITSDSLKAGKFVKGLPWEVNDLVVDTESGIFSIQQAVPPGSVVIATYVYRSKSYTYKSLNLNPVFSGIGITESRYIILIEPDNTSFCQNSLSHVVMGNDEVLTSASNTEINAWITAETRTFQDLKDTYLFIPGEDENNSKAFLPVALVDVGNPFSPQTSEIDDTRRRGGGLSEEFVKDDILASIPGSHNYYDIGTFDGPNVPIHNTLVVHLPTAIRDALPESEIRARCSKFAPAGSFILLEFY